MPGGRRTHDFPQGMPFPLIALTIVSVIGMLLYMVFAESMRDWYRYLPLIGLFAAYTVVHSRLLRHYERDGRAIPIHRQSIIVRFRNGLPPLMIAARASFFVTVAVMFGFGVAPLNVWTARKGIIGCVFALIAVAVINLYLEHHYVKVGRAQREVIL